MQVSLTDDIIDVLVQTQDWKRIFAHCIAVPSSVGCGHCGRHAAFPSLSPGDRDRAKACILGADAQKISSLKSALRASKLVIYTRADSGRLVPHII